MGLRHRKHRIHWWYIGNIRGHNICVTLDWYQWRIGGYALSSFEIGPLSVSRYEELEL